MRSGILSIGMRLAKGLSNFLYSKYLMNNDELCQLWELLKDKHNLFAGEYVGLKRVGFQMPLDKFCQMNRYMHELALRDFEIETKVLTSVQEAIEILSNVDIRVHHLSCAADVGVNDNTALCVHYRDPTNQKLYALAIPGINYVPSEDTIAKLRMAVQI